MNKFERKIGSVGQIGPDIDSNRPYSFLPDGNFDIESLKKTGVCFWGFYRDKNIIFADTPDERKVIEAYAQVRNLRTGYDVGYGNFGVQLDPNSNLNDEVEALAQRHPVLRRTKPRELK